MKFVKAKEVSTPSVVSVKAEKKPQFANQKAIVKNPNFDVPKPKSSGKSLPKRQRGPQTQHYCHHCGSLGHTRPNCFKLQALKNVDSQRPRRQGKKFEKPKQSKGQEREPIMGDVMKMINSITSCLANFTLRFENHDSSTQSSKDITINSCAVWVKKSTHA